MTLSIFTQIWLAVFSVTAVALTQSKRSEVRRYACIFGLLSQPAWFFAMWQTEQYGTFATCFVYAGLWARGYINFWIRKVPA